MAVFDTVRAAHKLMEACGATGADDPMVQVMLRWAHESQETKLAIWSEHACHEVLTISSS